MRVVSEHAVVSLARTPGFQRRLQENLENISKQLEFSLQKKKMVEVLGWDSAVVDDMEKDYIKFLALNKTLMDFDQEFKMIPNRFIDEFWHAHILDTEKYAKDCQQVFGQYFHHYPYYGMRNEEDRKDWLENAYICQEIWEISYGEKLYGDIDETEDSYLLDKEFNRKLSEIYKYGKEFSSMGLSRCRTTCKPQNCP
jgi:hypothetical protein